MAHLFFRTAVSGRQQHLLQVKSFFSRSLVVVPDECAVVEDVEADATKKQEHFRHALWTNPDAW
jgi:hypothetical protein